MNTTRIVDLIQEGRAAGNRPVLHGNGFIQLKTPYGRLHFWHPSLPRQEVSTPMHDHIFSMHSEILAGHLINRIWNVAAHSLGSHEVYVALPQPGSAGDTKLHPTGERVLVEMLVETTYGEGEKYMVPPLEFHETMDIQPAVTIMRKGDRYPGLLPRVLVPADEKPSNEWKRDAEPEEKLWDWIDQIVSECHRLPRP